MNSISRDISECSLRNEERSADNVQVEELNGHPSMFDSFGSDTKSKTNNKYLCFDF